MQMRLAILSILDCDAKNCIEVVKVKTDQAGVSKVLDVCTFEIRGHLTASKCFSWSVQENPSLIMISAVLMTPDVKTASDAVNIIKSAPNNSNQVMTGSASKWSSERPALNS